MNLQENLKMKGELTIRVMDSDGNLKQAIKVPNLVVDAGKVYIASRMVGVSSTVMNAMAIGSGGATSAIGSQTALVGELGRVSSGFTFTTSGSNTVTATATFPAGTGTGNVTEAGIFNNTTSGGTMLCRTTFPIVTKGSGDSIAITWVITVS